MEEIVADLVRACRRNGITARSSTSTVKTAQEFDRVLEEDVRISDFVQRLRDEAGFRLPRT